MAGRGRGGEGGRKRWPLNAFGDDKRGEKARAGKGAAGLDK